jgi:DNA-binding response OmpR family regulator
MRPSVRHRAALVVEDDATLRDTLAGLLEDEGFEVMTAKTIERARYILFESRHPVGVAIVDLGLPDGDGEGLITTMYANDARSIPTVLISATRERVSKLASAYGLPFLTKPFDLALAAATVVTTFDNDVRPHLRAPKG